jgi:tRNA (cmo5U34)-methyltransferase
MSRRLFAIIRSFSETEGDCLFLEGLHNMGKNDLEEMSAFFDVRAETYDSHMLDDLGLNEFYESIAACFSAPVHRLLDLGCGTGLELERLFELCPDAEVTGIDMSAEMLRLLETKYPGKKLRLICGSYFDADFGGQYSHALSTYSLHHFSEESKLGLYKRIYNALEPGGLFIFGDYTVQTIERQQELIAVNDMKRREQGIAEGEFYHFDTPFTAETEIKLMTAAGFAAVDIVRQWESTTIIIARK